MDECSPPAGYRACATSIPARCPSRPPASASAPASARCGNFIAIGLNYADHAAETGAAIPSGADRLQQGSVLHRRPERRRRHAAAARRRRTGRSSSPSSSAKRASYVGANEALDFIAGYCVCNDVSEREYQLERGGTWTKGKGCPTFGPLGPWLVTKDEIADLQNLRHVARRERRAHAEWLDADHDLQRRADRLLHLAFHDPGAGRRDHDRHTAGRRHGA